MTINVIPNLQLIDDPYSEYQLALASYLDIKFEIHESGVISTGEKLELHDLLDDDDDEIGNQETLNDYYKANGGYYELLDNVLENEMIERFSRTSEPPFDSLNENAGFRGTIDECIFPVYSYESTSNAYLITDDVEMCMYGQLCQNLWFIPEALLLKYLHPIDKQHLEYVLTAARQIRPYYSIYGTPISSITGHPLCINTFLKLFIRDGDKLLKEAISKFKPCEVLSTFDMKTEIVTQFNGKTYHIYDMSF